MEEHIIFDKFLSKASYPAQKILENDFVSVVAHYDCDGICAAAILAESLEKSGIAYQINFIKSISIESLQNICTHNDEMIVFCDIGTSYVKEISQRYEKYYIIDHHKADYLEGNVYNCHKFGMDGAKGASASSLAFFISLKILGKSATTSALAITGSIGDRQHIGGWDGLNKEIVDVIQKWGHIEKDWGLNLWGENIYDAILWSTEPYFKGLSGRKDAVNRFLRRCGISPGKRLYEMNEKEKVSLASLLTLYLLMQGADADNAVRCSGDKYYSDIGECHEISALINACSRTGNEDIGFLCARGVEKYRKKANDIRKNYRNMILNTLIEIEENGIMRKRHIQYFYSDIPETAGVLAALVMNFVNPSDMPTIVLSKKDADVKVSARTTWALVSYGVNLADACKKAAEKVGGYGGGHSIAAGATVHAGNEMKFLKILDEIIGGQLKNAKK